MAGGTDSSVNQPARDGSIAPLRIGDPEETRLWEHVVPRQVNPVDWTRFQGHVADILTAFGIDLRTPTTTDTPRRFLKTLFDSTHVRRVNRSSLRYSHGVSR